MSLATSFALSGAVNESMMEDSVRFTAQTLMEIHRDLDDADFHDFLFQYSANLVAVTAGFITKVFMTEDEIEKMMEESIELVKMSREAEQE